MSEINNAIGLIKNSLKSQYHSGLAMLKDAIQKCPDSQWADLSNTNQFWKIAYHTLYYVHLYSRPRLEEFTPWEYHQTCIQDLDDYPAPEDILKYTEPKDRAPQSGKPYTKEEIIEYWQFCENMIDDAVDKLDILSSESGFYWYKIPKLEHQLVNIRHLAHHAGQLSDRIRNVAHVGVGWSGAQGRIRSFED